MNFLTPFSDAIAAYENPNAVLACSDVLRRRGLSISPAQAKALCETRENALRQTARIEFRGGTLEKLIDAFSDSDFVRQTISSSFCRSLSIFSMHPGMKFRMRFRMMN